MREEKERRKKTKNRLNQWLSPTPEAQGPFAGVCVFETRCATSVLKREHCSSLQIGLSTSVLWSTTAKDKNGYWESSVYSNVSGMKQKDNERDMSGRTDENK